MGTPLLSRAHRRPRLATLGVLLGLLACDGPIGPDDPRLGHLRIWPDYETAVSPAELGLDSIGVLIKRAVDDVVLVPSPELEVRETEDPAEVEMQPEAGQAVVIAGKG